MENLLQPVQKNIEGATLWHSYFSYESHYRQKAFFISRCLVNSPPQQEMMTRELMSKIGTDEPMSDACVSLFNFDSNFENKIKNNWTKESGHWSEVFPVVHLIERKITGETQNDYNKILMNLFIMGNVADIRLESSTKDFIDFCRVLSNYSGNNFLGKEVGDKLVWGKINLSKESHAVLLQDFKEALFDINNYSDYKEVIRAIKDLDREEPKSIIAHYSFFKFLVKNFIPELESALLEKEMKPVNANQNVCKI